MEIGEKKTTIRVCSTYENLAQFSTRTGGLTIMIVYKLLNAKLVVVLIYFNFVSNKFKNT